MNVLVCGSRTYSDVVTLDRVLDELHDATPITAIADGMATGADTLGFTWAVKRGVEPRLRWRADWETHGRAAGPIRNAQMLAEFRPDLVLAFIDKPLSESRGTFDMVVRAEAAAIQVRVFGPGRDEYEVTIDGYRFHVEPEPEPEPAAVLAELTLF